MMPFEKSDNREHDRLDIADIQAKVDIGILTMRQDEFEVIIARFQNLKTVYGGKRIYQYTQVHIRNGDQLGVAIVRTIDQGQGSAQATATDLIEDLDPNWVFLVGIAGGFPDSEYTLGDVILASRVQNFAVGAALEGGKTESDLTGGPMHQDVDALLSNIPGEKSKLKGWNTEKALGMKKPIEKIGKTCPKKSSGGNFDGDQEWIKLTHSSLLKQFPANQKPRKPKYWVGNIISSNLLMKDTKLVKQWKKSARRAVAIEMELGGVYYAARYSGKRDYRVVVVRGLSDIVGYKRKPEWTEFACRSAASFAFSLISSGILVLSRPDQGKTTKASVKEDIPQISGVWKDWFEAKDKKKKIHRSIMIIKYDESNSNYLISGNEYDNKGKDFLHWDSIASKRTGEKLQYLFHAKDQHMLENDGFTSLTFTPSSTHAEVRTYIGFYVNVFPLKRKIHTEQNFLKGKRLSPDEIKIRDEEGEYVLIKKIIECGNNVKDRIKTDIQK